MESYGVEYAGRECRLEASLLPAAFRYPYVAPEVFRGEASCASDMWSAGIIALLMTTGPRHRNIHNVSWSGMNSFV